MTYALLCDTLHDLRIRVTLVDGRLKVHSPNGAMTAEIKQSMRDHVGALTRSLTHANSLRDE